MHDDNIKLAGRILQACIRAHERGVDAFANYSPHVDWLEVWIYRKGWTPDARADEHYTWHTVDNEWHKESKTLDYFSTKKALKMLSKELGEDLTHD